MNCLHRCESHFSRRKFSFLLLLILLFNTHVLSGVTDSSEIAFYQKAGYTVILGPLQGELPARPYVIIDTLLIGHDSTLSIEPGTLLYCKPGTPILVNGALICRGTSQAAISFTNISQNSLFNHPADNSDLRWEGIFPGTSAKLDLRYTVISQSKFGINASNRGCSIICDNILMRENGLNSLIYANDTIPVTPGEFCSLSLSVDEPLKSSTVYKDALAVQRRIHSEKNNELHKKKHTKLRICFAVSSGIGTIAAITGWVVNAVYYEKYANATDWTAYNPATVTRWEQYAKTGTITGITGVAVTAAALSGFTLTFLF